MVTVYKQTELELEVTGEVNLGSEDRYSSSFGNWLPGDKPEVKDLKVLLSGVDITKAFNQAELEEFEEELIEREQNDTF